MLIASRRGDLNSQDQLKGFKIRVGRYVCAKAPCAMSGCLWFSCCSSLAEAEKGMYLDANCRSACFLALLSKGHGRGREAALYVGLQVKIGVTLSWISWPWCPVTPSLTPACELLWATGQVMGCCSRDWLQLLPQAAPGVVGLASICPGTKLFPQHASLFPLLRDF